jgi:hypothetical protein
MPQAGWRDALLLTNFRRSSEAALSLPVRDETAAPVPVLEARMTAWFDDLRGPVLGYLLSIRVRHCEAVAVEKVAVGAAQLVRHPARRSSRTTLIKGWQHSHRHPGSKSPGFKE